MSTENTKVLSSKQQEAKAQIRTALEEMADLSRALKLAGKALVKKADTLGEGMDDDDWSDAVSDCLCLTRCYEGVALVLLDLEKLGVKIPQNINNDLKRYVSTARSQLR